MIERCKIDEKWRIKIPKSWREKFNKSLEIAIVKGENCLILYPKDKKSLYREDEIEIVGPARIDKWKRICLPLLVREMFPRKEIVLLQIKDCFEIWDYSRWKEWKERIKSKVKDKEIQQLLKEIAILNLNRK